MSYSVKSKIWIEDDGKILIGEGRARLLTAVGETGSLSAAARKLGMSYKKAWRLMDMVNQTARKPVVITSVGGARGGGAELTEYGRTLIQQYNLIKQSCWDHLSSSEKSLQNL